MQHPLSEEEGYGFAIMNSSKLISGTLLRGHTGSAYGLYSAMFFQPEKKYGFVVITNGCDPGYTNGFSTLLWETINSLYGAFIQKK